MNKHKLKPAKNYHSAPKSRNLFKALDVMSRRDEYRKFLNSIDWSEKRAVALDRTSGFCEYCGEVASQVHHTKYPKKFGDEHPSNLVAVCKRCHDLSHGIREMEKITEATRMSDLAPNGISLKYILTGGRVYASAKSWSRALQVPSNLVVWFETGLARTALLKSETMGSALEMEYLGTAVYRWHAVAEQLRAFDRKWYQDQFKNRPKLEQEQIKKFHSNYERLVSWGYDLQERALNSLINPISSADSPVTQDTLLAAIKEAVAPRLRQHDDKIQEHDIIISEIQNAIPILRSSEEFITVKQAINEQGLDSTSMPYYPRSKENLAGITGQILIKKNAETGDPVASRVDGQSLSIEVNTYRRCDIYEVLKEINSIQQPRLL